MSDTEKKKTPEDGKHAKNILITVMRNEAAERLLAF